MRNQVIFTYQEHNLLKTSTNSHTKKTVALEMKKASKFLHARNNRLLKIRLKFASRAGTLKRDRKQTLD